MAALTGGALLTGFALALGASNKTIGILAAIGPLAKILQLPAAILVDRFHRRKPLVLVFLSMRRLLWLLIAAVPFVFATDWQIPAFLTGYALYGALGSVSSCALSSWLRDIVPEGIVGRYFAKRLAIATGFGATLALGAGVLVDQACATVAVLPYSGVFVAAVLIGASGITAIVGVPEPPMQRTAGTGLLDPLRMPFRDANFRRLLTYTSTWSFAVNLAVPFFSVYMLTRLQLSIGWVVLLSSASQWVNLVFLKIWGELADRYSNKSVLLVAGVALVVCLCAWPFTAMPERHALTLPMLALIHILMAISTAGLNLCATGIAVKLAPRGQATGFLAVNALAAGAAAMVAPLVGGFLGDLLQAHTLTFGWSSGTAVVRNIADFLGLRGLDFVFIVAGILGMYSLHRLAFVHEEDDRTRERMPVGELYGEVMRTLHHVSGVGGMRYLGYFPFGTLRRKTSMHGQAVQKRSQ
jgi:MFS family permease